MTEKKYMEGVKYWEDHLKKHGDNYLGVGWTREFDAVMTYKMMLEVIRPEDKPATLLDFGCGLAHLYGHMKERGFEGIAYTGLDISDTFLKGAREKFPEIELLHMDALKDDSTLGMYDYIVFNGLFTSKRDLTFEEMFDYLTRLLKVLYRHCNKGIAFNAISKHVEWEREDLFHLPLDKIAAFLTKEISRHFIVRNDYGLFQQTFYIYKERCLLSEKDDGSSPFGMKP